MKNKSKRQDAVCLCLGVLNNGERTIEELTEQIYEHVTADTKGRTYEILSAFLLKGLVIPIVKNNMLYWRLNIKLTK